MRSRLIIAGLLAVALAGAGSLLLARQQLQSPLGASAEGYVLEIPAGQSFSALVNRLTADGIVSSPMVVKAYARWTGLDQRIQAGEYALRTDMSLHDMLDRLEAGEVILHSLTIVEGATVRELLESLAAHPAVETTLETTDPARLGEALGLPVAHAEGWFFPETYRFARGTTDRDLLLQAYALMESRLAANWESRAAELPLQSPYEALILASVIEKETALTTERPAIAGVFTRRLERGMRLQTDPTVIYGIGPDFNGNLTRRDLNTDTPYNTYTRGGLPPTPIALPGEGVLAAAVNPEPGDALYFVATGLPDGSHSFSETLEQHNAAVAAYLRRLRKNREGG